MRKSKEILERLKGENAEIMLESTIIIIIVLFMLIAMISVGFLFYQQCTLNTLTAEISEEIGANYKLTSLRSGDEDLALLNMYRTTFARGRSEQYHRKRAIEDFKEQLRIVSLGIIEAEPEVSVNVVIDGIGRMHVEVSASMESSVLFDGALRYFGIIDSTLEFTASAVSECIDITSMAGYIKFVDLASGKVEDMSYIMGIIDDVIKISDSIIDSVETTLS